MKVNRYKAKYIVWFIVYYICVLALLFSDLYAVYKELVEKEMETVTASQDVGIVGSIELC